MYIGKATLKDKVLTVVPLKMLMQSKRWGFLKFAKESL